MLGRLLGGSRYLVLFAVVSTFVAAATLLVYGTIETVVVVRDVLRAVVSAKTL